MASLFPPTVLVNGAAAPVPGASAVITDTLGNAAQLTTDSSGDASTGNYLIADATGTISPTSNPIYAPAGLYTVTYQDALGVNRTVAVTVTGAAPASAAAPSKELAQITATGPAVTTIQAAGAAVALPATPKGYLPATVNGVAVVIPFY